MTLLPIVTRELLVQARRNGTYWIRFVASAVASFLMLWLLMVGNAPAPTASQGRTLFDILSVLAFIYCLFVGALVTADCLSAEKRDGTLGLIFLTDLKGYDVVLGKMVSSSVHAVYGLLATVPMMSLTLLFGGVTAAEVGRMMLVLGNTLFFSLAAGMFVSTLSRNERRAIFMVLFIITLVSIGPYGLGYYLAHNFASGTAFEVNEAVLAPSPIYAFTLNRPTSIGTFRTAQLYSSVAQTNLIASMLLAFSCLIIPHVCQNREASRPRPKLPEGWRRWRIGGDPQHVKFRRRLLDRNPCFWLCTRERFKAASPWVLILPMAGIGFWIYVKYWQAFYETALLLVYTVHVLLKVWFAGETCHRWVEDRRSGSLELLLCAPLQVKEMAKGQSLSLRRQFAWPVAVTLTLTLVAWLVIIQLFGRGHPTEFGRTWLLLSIPLLMADLIALRWVGAWRALNARGLNRATAATLARVLGLSWLIYLVSLGIARTWWWIGYGQLPYISEPWVWMIEALLLDACLAISARRMFLTHFRSIAANPFGQAYVSETVVSSPAPSISAESSVSVNSKKLPGFRWPSNPKTRRRLVVMAVALVIIGLLPTYRFSLKWRIQSRIRTLRRAGLPTSMADIERLRPPMTNRVDAAEVLNRASRSMMNWNSLPLAVSTNLPPMGGVLPRGLDHLQEKAISEVLASNREALAILEAAPSLADGAYILDQKTRRDQAQQQFGVYFGVSRLLGFQVLFFGHKGDTTNAIASLKRLFQLGRSAKGQMWSLPTSFHAISLTRWLLNRRSFSDAELIELDREIAQCELQVNYEQALSIFRCAGLDLYRSSPDKLTSSPQPILTIPGGPGSPPPAVSMLAGEIRLRLRSWSGVQDREFIEFLDGIEELMRAVKGAPAERYSKARDAVTGGVTRPMFAAGLPIFGFTRFGAFESVIRRITELDARCRTARIALALERFRLLHGGARPEELSVIVPDFIQAIPVDPFDGQGIRYKNETFDYRVYSVGPNGRDDNGDEMNRPGAANRPPFGDDITFSIER